MSIKLPRSISDFSIVNFRIYSMENCLNVELLIEWMNGNHDWKWLKVDKSISFPPIHKLFRPTWVVGVLVWWWNVFGDFMFVSTMYLQPCLTFKFLSNWGHWEPRMFGEIFTVTWVYLPSGLIFIERHNVNRFTRIALD